MNKNFSDLLYLCRCAVNNQIPESSRVSEMNIELLYKTARFHTLTAVTAYALESAGITDHNFEQAKEKAMRKNMFLDLERKKLFKYFEETGIWYMQLKGTVLKDIYPELGMRQMADNDILFDAAFQETVRDYFVKQEYDVISFDQGNHDVYKKPPVLNFEMHTSLFGKGHNEKWQKYYADIKERLIKNENTEYGYHFTDEDFYVYITTHEYKHHTGAGTGIRSLLDCYVYLKNKSDSLDWNYIEAECEKLGIAEFEKQSRETALKIFGNSEHDLSASDMEFLDQYLTSGTYGTLENAVKTRMKKYADKTGRKSKYRYILNRLIPDDDYYRSYAPFFRKYKILRPFFLFYRLFRGLILHGKNVLTELKTIRKV